jgi:hypothetical protein
MNNKQQTAVEWLVKELNQKIDFIPITQWESIKEIIKQAKEMEKEQIVNTWSQATTLDYEIGLLDASYILCQIHNAEQYYNETYGADHIGDINKKVDEQ